MSLFGCPLWPAFVLLRTRAFILSCLPRGELLAGYTANMSWAGGRRFLILAIIAAFVVAVIALTSIATFYEAPSCSDVKQNQGEAGIDCGGPCAYLCTAGQQAPVVRFTKAVLSSGGRVDVIAYVDNPNVDAAARRVPYKITLYAADHTVLKTSTGTLDLPPTSSVPVYVPSFFTGNTSGAQAFLTISPNTIKWFALSRKISLPTVSSPLLGGTNIAPRITATLSNSGTTPFADVKVIAIVYDSASNVIGASQTVIPSISGQGLPGQGSALATFTWGEAFPSTPTRIEIVPIISLSP